MQHDANSQVRPSLLRICIARDGRLKANFSDNSILVLNASGSAFVHCLHASSNSSLQPTQASPAVAASAPLFNSKPDCSPIVSRQLSEYALSRHVPQLRVALEFRNMHLDQPFFCQPLLRKEPRPQGLSLGFLISELWWPRSAEDALAAGLAQQLPDGRVAVSTADSSARMVLHHHRRRFAVCYPLLVEESPVEGKYHYVWHTQVFSMQDIPARWQSASELLRAVSDRLQEEEAVRSSDTAAAAVVHHRQLQQQYQQQYQQQQQQQERQHGHQGGLLLPLAADACSPPPSRCTPLPIATQRGLSGTTGTFAPGSWWLEPTLTLFPPDDVILLEWTPSALYQFYPSSCEAEVWVGHDESCLTTVKQGRYFRHFRCAQDSTRVLDQLYAASAVPEFVWARPPLRTSPQPHKPQSAKSSPATHTHPTIHNAPSPQSSALLKDGRQQEKAAAHEGDVGRDGLSRQPSADPHIPCKGAGATAGAAAGADMSRKRDASSVASGGNMSAAGANMTCKGDHRAAAGEIHGLSQTPTWESRGLPHASRYPLATLAAHALKLREQMRLVVAAQAMAGGLMVGGAMGQQDAFVAPSMGVEESFGVVSEKVLEHAEVPGQGTFSAYEDGRVRAMFADRTILHLNAAQSHCKAFLPDGASLLVSTDNPVGIEQYMQVRGLGADPSKD
ncbi:hypothetical protein DUNSADRAFT_10246 [Dunaliella salina]|uniref:Uncharacterized protein n=1 Tax=Dunaliella salina TaxID=3046 RepID=A0ABQ7GFS8_DUNSA|nr:hypothetical protein DUNSADRAFT_10246 [Dunaliella salina]|eukprot:KAF5833456.1 hypothetical protein DUNSADRAFT_10246 [Dunaliella salina]